MLHRAKRIGESMEITAENTFGPNNAALFTISIKRLYPRSACFSRDVASSTTARAVGDLRTASSIT